MLGPGPGRAGPRGRDPDADPDVDGVALAAATATGVLLGTRFAVAGVWVAAAGCLALACLGAGATPRFGNVGGGPRPGVGGGGSRPRVGGGGRAVVGVLVLGTLVASGGAAASVRAAVVRGSILLGWARQPGRAEVAGTVAEEPRRVRHGGLWVVLTVTEVRRDGRTYRTRERAGLVVPQGRLPPAPRPVGSPVPGPPAGQERLAVGDRLRVRASVGAARWGDALGRQPPVVLRKPVIEERAPPRGAALRVSERLRQAARNQALASLAPERAGLLVGMALGDTSLLPAELEGDFRAAGLTHLMVVSGA